MQNITASKKRGTGFTLAEVLVTLAIIGVVAALTIPTLIKNYKKQQWIVGYKETYSIVKQTTGMIKANNDNSLLNAWTTNDQSMYNAYLPYIHVLKKCENEAPEGNCFASGYTYLNGSSFSVRGTYSVILSNGASLSFWSPSPAGLPFLNHIMIDTNGPKGPNVAGKDLHWIDVTTNVSIPVQPYSAAAGSCPSDLGTSGDGLTCGLSILKGDYAKNY